MFDGIKLKIYNFFRIIGTNETSIVVSYVYPENYLFIILLKDLYIVSMYSILRQVVYGELSI